jgi:plasmid stabilization system protein ParE
VKVLWTNSAVAQLQAIHDYLAQTSPDYAVRIVDRLTRRSIQIAAFPNSGRMVPDEVLMPSLWHLMSISTYRTKSVL